MNRRTRVPESAHVGDGAVAPDGSINDDPTSGPSEASTPTGGRGGRPGADPSARVSEHHATGESPFDALLEPADVQVWREFRSTGSQELRDRLILAYAPLVRYVADRLRVGLPAHVDARDLYSAGTFGLINAVDRYDPSLGVPFESYARTRIRGSIIDELRAVDWVPRSVRTLARQVEQAMAQAQGELQRTPTDEEVADRAGISLDELHQLYAKVGMAHVAALDEVMRARPLAAEGELTDSALDPEQAAEHAWEQRELREAIAELPHRDQQLLGLYYVEGFTMAEVGEVLGVTESRVSQLHTRAMLRLRALLSHRQVSRPTASH